MAKNYAIAIGINHYEHIHRPLQYAASDAEKVRDFLVNEAQFDRVFYYSDNSPDIKGASTRPTRSNLLRRLNVTFQKPFMGDGDNFWFFFSGHGARVNDIDYLIPCDGFVEDVENSGISVNYIIRRLQRCGADNVVLILDACREKGGGLSKGIKGVGEQTEEEARKTGIISISSCSPSEYSWEFEELKQGVFTYALLEGLGSKGQKATVERLNEYLQYRVRELAGQKGKRQTPRIMADPIEKSHLILMPKYATLSDIAVLKNDAARAERKRNFTQAKILWRRVLNATQGDDEDAIEALAHIKFQELYGSLNQPPQPPKPDASNSPKTVESDIPESQPQPEPEPEIELKSEVGVDYSQLQKLLSEGKWKEADEETARVMLKAAKRESEGWLDRESIQKFPCADLRTIDQLWVKYSGGRFGFSVQKRVYVECGANLDGEYPGDEIWYKFCDKVGWKRGPVGWRIWRTTIKSWDELTFSMVAPRGHLPAINSTFLESREGGVGLKGPREEMDEKNQNKLINSGEFSVKDGIYIVTGHAIKTKDD